MASTKTMTESKTFESFSDKLITHLKSRQDKLEMKDAGFMNLVKIIRNFEQDDRDSRKASQLPGVMTFGKYKDKAIKDVYELDAKYCMWLNKNNQYLSEENREILNKLVSVE
jgi:uncharacterized protein (DUF3820 family)